MGIFSVKHPGHLGSVSPPNSVWGKEAVNHPDNLSSASEVCGMPNTPGWESAAVLSSRCLRPCRPTLRVSELLAEKL